jgi:NAD(P)-dependent dehydrogenase (short-subunit alcohol dehydrogenase family)
MRRLEGRLAVVTGASRGIGHATAQALAAEGATVVRLGRSLADQEGDGFHDLPCDLADVPGIIRTAGRILEQWGAPSLVVNNAGVFDLKPFEGTDSADLDRAYAINLRAPFVVSQAFLPAMRGAGGGLVISVGSVADHVGFADNSTYAATKTGLRGLHAALAAEYRGTGIRFTLVSPGPTDTGLWRQVDLAAHPGIPSPASMLRPEDVAEAIVFAATRPPRVTIEWIRLLPNVPGEGP